MSTNPTGVELTHLQRHKLEHRFNLIDANSDGLLQQEDYEQAAAKIAAAFGQEPGSPHATALREAYLALWTGLSTRMDADGDRKVTRDEFVAAIAGSVIARNRDHDGRLTLDEIIAALCDYYTSLDPNAPGNALFGTL